MQRQIEKATELIRMIVQKLEIPAEIEVDDGAQSDKTAAVVRLQKFRHAFSLTRRGIRS